MKQPVERRAAGTAEGEGSPAIVLRPARADDALCLGVLGLQVFLDTYAPEGIRPSVAREVLAAFGTAAIAARLARPASLCIVAERAGHLIGFAEACLGITQVLVEGPAPAELERLYLQAPFIGRGLGARLLHAAEDEAAARGAGTLWLTAWVHNRRALDFYARQGYRDLGATAYVFEQEAHENRVLARALAGRRGP